MKIHRLVRRTKNILNKNRSNITCFSDYSLKLSLQLPKEYFERLVSNNDVGYTTMIRVLSFMLVKKVASLSVDELQGSKVDQTIFILAYEAFSQLVRSQKLFKANKNGYVCIIFEIKYVVAVSNLRKKDMSQSKKCCLS